MQLNGNNGTDYNVFKTFCKVHFVWRNHKQVTHWPGTIWWPPVECWVHPPSVAATSWPFWDMSSSRLLKVCCSIWHQDVINRFSKLHLEPSTNQFLVFPTQMLDWIEIWRSLTTHLTGCCALQSFLNYFCFVVGYIQSFLEDPACHPPIVQPMHLLLPCALLFHVHYPHDNSSCSWSSSYAGVPTVGTFVGQHGWPWTHWGDAEQFTTHCNLQYKLYS